MADYVTAQEKIAQLWAQIGTSIDEPAAMRQAAAMAGELEFAPGEAEGLASVFRSVVEQDAYLGVIAARLLRTVAANIAARSPGVAWSLSVGAMGVYITFIGLVGDGDVQHEAIELATSMRQIASGEAELGQAWLQLGLAYTQGIISRTTTYRLTEVLANRMDQVNRGAIARPPGDPHPPLQREPLSALRSGIEALDEALRHGRTPMVIKSAALERLAAARYLSDLGCHDAQVTKAELEAIGHHGLASATDDPLIAASILSELRSLGSPLTDEEDRLLAIDPVQMSSDESPQVAAWVAAHLLKARLDRPDEAAQYAASASALAPHLGEADRSSLLRTVFNAVTLPMAMAMKEEPDFEATEPWLRRFLASRDLSTYQQAGAILVLAVAAGVPLPDQMRLAQEALTLDEAFGSAIEAAVAYGVASSRLDSSFEALQAGDYATYIADATSTIPIWSAIGISGASREVLSKIDQLLSQITDDVVEVTLASLMPHITDLESAPLSGNSELLQRIWRRVLAIAVQHGGDLLRYLTLFQVAKAARTAAILRAGPRRLDTEDRDRLLSFLTEANRLRASATQAAPAEPFADPMLTELRMVMPYKDRLDSGQSDDPLVQAANLERTFDSRLQGSLLRSAGAFEPRSVDEVMAVLSPGTVLWSIYEGEDIAGRPCLYSLLVARDEPPKVIHRVVAGMHDQLGVGRDESSIVCTNHEVSVATVRLALAAGTDNTAATEAIAYLEQLSRHLFEEVIGELQALYKRGHRRLIIDACGALHVFPFHLMDIANGPLGCRWTVTSTPSIEALFGDERRLQARAVPIGAFGMTFRDGGGHGLSPLWEVQPEVSAVAAAFNATPCLDRACTEPAVMNGLTSARFVHIASHGRQDVAAPSLQEIYVTATADDDGRLRAHEIMTANLAGLEMATLSACETALGRVDISDNPRGLVSALMLGGAQSVVGTLWEVDDAAAQTFFSHLYERLADGSSRVEAFHAARMRAWERHPLPCDWGAFVYLGY